MFLKHSLIYVGVLWVEEQIAFWIGLHVTEDMMELFEMSSPRQGQVCRHEGCLQQYVDPPKFDSPTQYTDQFLVPL